MEKDLKIIEMTIDDIGFNGVSRISLVDVMNVALHQVTKIGIDYSKDFSYEIIEGGNKNG